MKSLTDMSASSWPRPITIKCSAVSAISLIRCEETKTVRPSEASCFIRLRTHRMPSGSRPLTGSSKSSTCGSPSSAAAMPSRWPMPEREALGAPPRDVLQAHHAEHLVDPAGRDAGQLGEREQVLARAAAAVHRLGVEQRAHLAGGVGELAEGVAADGGVARGRGVQAQNHAHRRRLAGAVGPQEAGDRARPYLERQVVHGRLGAIALRQADCLDHSPPLARCLGAEAPSCPREG